jgi:hypothetical protein
MMYREDRGWGIAEGAGDGNLLAGRLDAIESRLAALEPEPEQAPVPEPELEKGE